MISPHCSTIPPMLGYRNNSLSILVNFYVLIMTTNAQHYTINEGSFSLPNNWQDESLNVFSFNSHSGGNLVINRTPITEDISDQDFYQKIIEQFRHNLNGYQENECREITLEGKPAYLLDYYWDTPEGPIYQLSVLYIVQNKLLTFTYSAQESFSPNKKEALLTVVYSFKTTSKTN